MGLGFSVQVYFCLGFRAKTEFPEKAKAHIVLSMNARILLCSPGALPTSGIEEEGGGLG